MQTLGCAAVALAHMNKIQTVDSAPRLDAAPSPESPERLGGRRSSGVTALPVAGQPLKDKVSDSSCSTSSGDCDSPLPSSKIDNAEHQGTRIQSISPIRPMPRHQDDHFEDAGKDPPSAPFGSKAHIHSPVRPGAAPEPFEAGVGKSADILNSTGDHRQGSNGDHHRFARASAVEGSKAESFSDENEGSTTSRLRMDLRLLGMETPPQLSRTALLALLMEQAANVSQRAQARPLPPSMAHSFFPPGPRPGYISQVGRLDASGFNGGEARGYPRVMEYANESMWSQRARLGADVLGTYGGNMLGNDYGESAIQRLRTIGTAAQQSKMAVMVRAESHAFLSHWYTCTRSVCRCTVNQRSDSSKFHSNFRPFIFFLPSADFLGVTSHRLSFFLSPGNLLCSRYASRQRVAEIGWDAQCVEFRRPASTGQHHVSSEAT